MNVKDSIIESILSYEMYKFSYSLPFKISGYKLLDEGVLSNVILKILKDKGFKVISETLWFILNRFLVKRKSVQPDIIAYKANAGSGILDQRVLVIEVKSAPLYNYEYDVFSDQLSSYMNAFRRLILAVHSSVLIDKSEKNIKYLKLILQGIDEGKLSLITVDSLGNRLIVDIFARSNPYNQWILERILSYNLLIFTLPLFCTVNKKTNVINVLSSIRSFREVLNIIKLVISGIKGNRDPSILLKGLIDNKGLHYYVYPILLIPLSVYEIKQRAGKKVPVAFRETNSQILKDICRCRLYVIFKYLKKLLLTSKPNDIFRVERLRDVPILFPMNEMVSCVLKDEYIRNIVHDVLSQILFNCVI